MEKPLQVFCCYAREDQSFLLQLKTYLSPLVRDELIIIQADIDISPGEEWEHKISQWLNTAHIILLLISPDFMASDYCYSKEMMRAMERHGQGEARVVPIILRPALWDRAPFARLQALPKNAKPLRREGHSRQERAFLGVAKGIRKVVEELIEQSVADGSSIQQTYVTSEKTLNSDTAAHDARGESEEHSHKLPKSVTENAQSFPIQETVSFQPVMPPPVEIPIDIPTSANLSPAPHNASSTIPKTGQSSQLRAEEPVAQLTTDIPMQAAHDQEARPSLRLIDIVNNNYLTFQQAYDLYERRKEALDALVALAEQQLPAPEGYQSSFDRKLQAIDAAIDRYRRYPWPNGDPVLKTVNDDPRLRGMPSHMVIALEAVRAKLLMDENHRLQKEVYQVPDKFYTKSFLTVPLKDKEK